MKFLLFCHLYWLLSIPIFSQEKDDHFNISGVVMVDSLSASELILNAKKWLIKSEFKNIDTTSLNKFSGESDFYVYQKGLVSKQIHGKVSYKVLLEIKDFKYKYIFSDFIYHYYKQNKSYQFVPTGKTKPFEEKDANGWQKTWDKHKQYTRQQVQILIDHLKHEMQYRPVIPTLTKKDDF